MAILGLEDINETSGVKNDQIKFFTLKRNNEEALVRFAYDNEKEFDLLSVHNVYMGGRYRKVNCIRGTKDPIEMCPLCVEKAPLQQRFFIKMLTYEQNQKGEMIVTPKVWERPPSYAYRLVSYLNNFGSLKDILCKIIRRGEPNSQKTDYEIVPNLSQSIYPPQYFPNDFSAFDDCKILGRMVFDKTKEELNHYIQTGEFPKTNNQNNSQNTSFTYERKPEYSGAYQPPQTGYGANYPPEDVYNTVNEIPKTVQQPQAPPPLNQTGSPNFYPPRSPQAPSDAPQNTDVDAHPPWGGNTTQPIQRPVRYEGK